MQRRNIFIVTVLFACSISQIYSKSIFDDLQNSIDEMQKEFAEMKKDMEEIAKKQDLPKVESGYDKDKKVYFIKMQLPGFEKKDIEIKVDSTNEKERIIFISAEKKSEKEHVSKVNSFEKKEFKSGFKQFQTTQTLPADVKVDKIDWSYENNLLEIKIPVGEKERKIKVIKARGQKG